MSLNVELARNNMIEQQVRPWDVLDERVLEALSAIRREDFLPEAVQNLAFADMELPLGHGEVALKPVIEAYSKAPYVALWLDTALGQNVGNALNTGVVEMLAGQGDAKTLIQKITDAAARG